MTKKKLQLSEVVKKYLKTAGYILIMGIVAYISKHYLKVNEDLALVFGGLADFITYIMVKEIKNEGIREALK